MTRTLFMPLQLRMYIEPLSTVLLLIEELYLLCYRFSSIAVLLVAPFPLTKASH